MIEYKTIEQIQPLKGDKELNLLMKMIKDGWPKELTIVPDSYKKV